MKQNNSPLIKALLIFGLLMLTTLSFTQGIVTGELKKWHRITITFDGPEASETGKLNPFTDYRFMVDFSNGSTKYRVPGFFAADGMAADSGAASGNKWRVRFAPDKTGTWTYRVSFRQGEDIALEGDDSTGEALAFDGAEGTFKIGPTDKTGRDFRARGRLAYVGEHYLKFLESGKYFIKGGADAPEGTLVYTDFDSTPGGGPDWNKGPHIHDFESEAEDYTWKNGKGKGLLGAINYLSKTGANAMSFLTYNLNGDIPGASPHVSKSGKAAKKVNEVFLDRFDVSKTAQWERVFSYAETQGIFLHFKTMEQENCHHMDDNKHGVERSLYYKELIARFGHHLALNWNLSEETKIPIAEMKKTFSFLKQWDPYGHHRVVHTFPGKKDSQYPKLMDSDMTGASVQHGYKVHGVILKWLEQSAAKGRNKWCVAHDEQGGANTGVEVDPEGREAVRTSVLWGTLMAGGWGVEYYYGYKTGCKDQDCNDHRTRESKYKDVGRAVRFFEITGLNKVINKARNRDELVNKGDWCLAVPSEYYIVYMQKGSSRIKLPAGEWKVQYYDPKNDKGLIDGGTTTGNLDSGGSGDWVAYISKTVDNGGGGTCGDVNKDSQVNIVDALLIAQLYIDPDFNRDIDKQSADVNNDGAVDIVDALLLAQFYVGIISQLNC